LESPVLVLSSDCLSFSIALLWNKLPNFESQIFGGFAISLLEYSFQAITELVACSNPFLGVTIPQQTVLKGTWEPVEKAQAVREVNRHPVWLWPAVLCQFSIYTFAIESYPSR